MKHTFLSRISLLIIVAGISAIILLHVSCDGFAMDKRYGIRIYNKSNKDIYVYADLQFVKTESH